MRITNSIPVMVPQYPPHCYPIPPAAEYVSGFGKGKNENNFNMNLSRRPSVHSFQQGSKQYTIQYKAMQSNIHHQLHTLYNK